MSDQTPRGNGGFDAGEKSGRGTGSGKAGDGGARRPSAVARWVQQVFARRSARLAALAVAVVGIGAGLTIAMYSGKAMEERFSGSMFSAAREAETPSRGPESFVARAEPVFVEPAAPARPVPAEPTTPRGQGTRPAPESEVSGTMPGDSDRRVEPAREGSELTEARRPVLHVMPAEAERVVQGPGWRRHPVYKEWRYQPGVEFALPRGTEVKAAGAGVVVFAGYDEGLGLTVRVRHDDGWLSMYGYLDAVHVAQDARVEGGDVIGRSGLTPWHEARLFFGVWKDGTAVDPVPLLTR